MIVRALPLFALLLGWFQLFASEPLNVYYFGNSLTDELKYDAFQKLCAEAGQTLEWDRQMAPGVPVSHHWKNRERWGEEFNEKQWDVVTLQPFQVFELEYYSSENFARYLKENQPGVQLYIYAQWPHRGNPNWEAAFTNIQELDPQGQHDWVASNRRKHEERFWLENVAADAVGAGYPARAERSLKNSYELIVQGINARVGLEKPVKLIPVGHVFQLLGSKMRAGMVPGYTNVYDLYSDGVHVNNVGSYIVACTFYATLFGKSPVGLPVGAYQGDPGRADDRYPIPPALARVIQETVWEVVATHPLTGVRSDRPVEIATASLPSLISGEPARTGLMPAFGKPPYQWAVTRGTLPEGLAMDENGRITGTVAASPGSVPVEFAVRDADGAVSRKAFRLEVMEDKSPRIVTDPALPPRRLGEYFRLKLTHTSGNGAVEWSAGKNNDKLPPGLVLSPEGILSGAPSREGEYRFKITARDEDLGSSESDTRSFNLRVAPAGPGVIEVPEVATGNFTFDGKPDEEFWKPRYPIAKQVVGSGGDLRAAFDIASYRGKLILAVWVQDPDLHPNRKEQADGDSIEIFLDVLNNREDTYNFDDRRILLVPTERWYSPITIAPSKFGIGRKWTKFEGGYAAEFSLLYFPLGIRSTDLPRVLGFDIAVNDDDTGAGRTSQMVWQGTAENATRPDSFGTILIGNGE